MKICRECGRRCAVVHPVTRSGGGTYRRPPRMYRSTICEPCIQRLLASDNYKRAKQHHLSCVDGWSVRGLERAAGNEGADN